MYRRFWKSINVEISTACILFVSLLHVGFFFLESVLWTKPAVRRLFGLSEAEAHTTKTLALNQGFYNLGSAALLMCFLATNNTEGLMAVLVFIVCMGLIGAITANWRIILLQSIPALAALLLLL